MRFDTNRRGCRLGFSYQEVTHMFDDDAKNAKDGGVSRREFSGDGGCGDRGRRERGLKLAWAVDSKTGMHLPDAGAHRRESLDDGTGRVSHRRAKGRAGKHSNHSHRDRQRRQLSGQLLGLQRRRERSAHGQGAARRLPAARLPDDQDRRAYEEGGGANKSKNRCAGCRPTTSTCCSFTR